MEADGKFVADGFSQAATLYIETSSHLAPRLGSLISATIGKGRHNHTSLVLHHQLDHLVPSAFLLLANLVQSA